MGISVRVGYQQIKILKKIAKETTSLIKLSNNENRNISRVINRLEERGLINLGGDIVELTLEGQKILNRIEAEDIKIVKPEKWDQIWHIVAYDIPEDFKKERDYFRQKLKEFGFVNLQESMWLFPYNCKEEIAIFTQSINISPFVIYLNTDHVPNQNRYIDRFNL